MVDLQSSSAEEQGLPAPHRPNRTPRGTRARTALVATVIVAAAGGGYAIAGCVSGSPAPAAGDHGGPAAAPSKGDGDPGMGSSMSSLAQSIGKEVGTALAGTAPQTVTTSQARTLGNQVPSGASVDKAANQLVFTGSSVSFTVLAVPPGGPDMTFRVAGLTNPALVIPQGAQVTVEFINADPDEAHGWLVTDEQPPFSFGQRKVPSISGAFSGLIGDPTASGDGASAITFQAGPAGIHQYICPVPGHAQMGMHGAFIVR
jgi:hypothetical protein